LAIAATAASKLFIPSVFRSTRSNKNASKSSGRCADSGSDYAGQTCEAHGGNQSRCQPAPGGTSVGVSYLECLVIINSQRVWSTIYFEAGGRRRRVMELTIALFDERSCAPISNLASAREQRHRFRDAGDKHYESTPAKGPRCEVSGAAEEHPRRSARDIEGDDDRRERCLSRARVPAHSLIC
jgi:hypothetical protein